MHEGLSDVRRKAVEDMKKLREKSGTLKGFLFCVTPLCILHFNPDVNYKLKVCFGDESRKKFALFISFIFVYMFCPISEGSEAASKQILAKAEQIRKFQEENKYLGQLVSQNLSHSRMTIQDSHI